METGHTLSLLALVPIGTYDPLVPILQNRASNDRCVRSHALTAEGVWLHGEWTINDQNDLLARLFGL